MEIKPIVLRTRIVFLLVVLFAILIFGKICSIQFVNGAKWSKLAVDMHLEYRPLKATRGNICAEDGSFFATTLPFYRLVIDPCAISDEVYALDIKNLCQLLSNFYRDKSPADYKKIFDKARATGKRYLIVNKKYITHSQQKIMCQWPILSVGKKHGVIFEKVEKRFYPFGDLALRSIGFINEENKGAGIEYSFNKQLSGINGSALFKKSTGGIWKLTHNGYVKKPIHGYDIQTTIDINLQDAAHTSLLAALKASKALYGCVIVMEVKTGEIKAIANLSLTKDGDYKEIYNYAIGDQGTREPGSTFKLVSMIALLEEKDIDINSIIDTGNGTFVFYDCVMKDVAKEGFGKITIREAFEQSSNIAISKLVNDAFGNNPQKFLQYIDECGLTTPLNFEIIGVGVPYFPAPKSKEWSGVTLPWMSIGYGIKVSPLQILMLYNAVANNGKMLKPFIVKYIKNAGKIVQEFNPIVLKNKICSDKTLATIKQLLEGVVERGRAKKFKHGFYKIAGKSGTANTVDNGKYTGETYASFVGYFPANAPQYSCIVAIDSPKDISWHFGGSLAGVVKEIADKIASTDILSQDFIDTDKKELYVGHNSYVGNTKEIDFICKELNMPCSNIPNYTWGILNGAGNKFYWKQHNVTNINGMPCVIGMTLRDALYILENAKFRVNILGNKYGRVYSQQIAPDSSIKNLVVTIKMK
jgi:cell division protein FtsI (penicillin-binding protein 3)